jgi:hypothetical protein
MKNYKPKQPDTPELNAARKSRAAQQEAWMQADLNDPAFQNLDARIAELEAQNAEVDKALAHMTKLRDALKDPNDA